MLSFVLLLFAATGINCEPETVRENLDYFSYGSNEDALKNLDLHLVRIRDLMSRFDLDTWLH